MSKRIKALRAYMGKSQKEFAKELGVDKATVSGWETGRSLIALRYLLKIQDIYDVDFGFFDVRKNLVSVC